MKEERREIINFLIDYAMKNPEMEVVTEQLYDDGVYLLQRVAESDPETCCRDGEASCQAGRLSGRGQDCQRRLPGQCAPLPLLAGPDNRQYSGRRSSATSVLTRRTRFSP